MEQFGSVKHRATIRPSNSTPTDILKRSEKICPQKTCTQKYMAASFTNSQKMETSQMPITDE